MSRQTLVCVGTGTAFGFLFCAAGFNQYNVIHRMLLLQNFNPYLVMGSAVLTAMPLLWLLERRKWRTPFAGEMQLKRFPIERKHYLGGSVFGVGWAVTGACPGTISGMLGAGSLLGLVTLAGFFGGMFLRDTVVERAGTAPSDSALEPAPVLAAASD